MAMNTNIYLERERIQNLHSKFSEKSQAADQMLSSLQQARESATAQWKGLYKDEFTNSFTDALGDMKLLAEECTVVAEAISQAYAVMEQADSELATGYNKS